MPLPAIELPAIPGGWGSELFEAVGKQFDLWLPQKPDAFLDDPGVIEANRRDDYMPYWRHSGRGPRSWPGSSIGHRGRVTRSCWNWGRVSGWSAWRPWPWAAESSSVTTIRWLSRYAATTRCGTGFPIPKPWCSTGGIHLSAVLGDRGL